MKIISEGASSFKIIVREEGSFWIEHEESITLIISIIMLLLGFALIFSPFYTWIEGRAVMFVLTMGGVSIDGLGTGRIYYYAYEGFWEYEEFKCPDILPFSVLSSSLGASLLILAIVTIRSRFRRGYKDISSFYDWLSKLMFLIGSLCIGLYFIFLLSYENFSIYGLNGVSVVKEIPQYLASLDLKISAIGPSAGPLLLLIVGFICIVSGIIFSITSAKFFGSTKNRYPS